MCERRASSIYASSKAPCIYRWRRSQREFEPLPTNQPLVVLCHYGARSQMVVDFLRNAGFDNAVNLEGGIEAWACEIDQSMRRYR